MPKLLDASYAITVCCAVCVSEKGPCWQGGLRNPPFVSTREGKVAAQHLETTRITADDGKANELAP
jgi:hypothetical protein